MNLMKQFAMVALMAAALYACGGEAAKEEEKKPIATAESTNDQIGGTSTGAKDGKALIEASDCRTCHKDNEKLIGPAYTEVAAKYEATEANIDTLANRILKGNVGVWGQVPMTAHPTLSLDDAKAMVTYILSMKQ